MIGAIGNTNYATDTTGGVVKITLDNGVNISNEGQLQIARATPDLIKTGSNMLRPITPLNVHQAAFYGLSKAAGVDLANETVTFGTYPDNAQQAIRSMISAVGATDLARQTGTVTNVTQNYVDSSLADNSALWLYPFGLAVLKLFVGVKANIP